MINLLFLLNIGLYLRWVFVGKRLLIISTMPLVLVFHDIMVMYGNSLTPVLRAIVMIISVILLSSKTNKLVINRSLVLFLTYLSIIVFFYTNSGGQSLNTGIDFIARMIITLSFFHLAVVHLNTPEEFKSFLKFVIYSGLIFIGYVVAANVFGFGGAVYSDSDEIVVEGLIRVGNMAGGSFNFLAYLIVLALASLIYLGKNQHPWFAPIIIFLGTSILALVLRRSSLVIVLNSFLVLLLTNKTFRAYLWKRLFMFSGLFVIAVIIIGASFYGLFETAISVRGDHAFTVENLSTAGGRMNEIEFMINHIKQESVLTQFFGKDMDTTGLYGHSRRSLHSNISVLLYRFGYVGLGLFGLFLVRIFATYRKVANASKTTILNSLFYAVFVTNLFMMVPGRMTSISDNVIVFVTLGAIVGVLSKKTKHA